MLSDNDLMANVILGLLILLLTTEISNILLIRD
jgi:hypothetical protein